jgi:hypothetical protein
MATYLPVLLTYLVILTHSVVLLICLSVDDAEIQYTLDLETD